MDSQANMSVLLRPMGAVTMMVVVVQQVTVVSLTVTVRGTMEHWLPG
jgi:hypothetical protein